MVIPASITSISSDAFNSCSKLNEVISLKPTAPELGANCFQFVSGDLKIKVPSASVEKYQIAENWSSYSSKIEAIPTTYSLSDGTDYKIAYEYSGCDITYTRNVTHNNWHGFYLPFDVDVTKVSGTCATLTSVSDNTLNWATLSSGIIAAGTPFIYKPTTAGDISFSVTNATIHSCTESHPATSNGYTLSGTYTTKSDMATAKAYALSNGNFYYTENNSKTLKPYRIYLTVPESVYASARICSLIDGEDVTGIDDIDVDLDVDLQNKTKTYNLLGQPVGSGYKGIVIVNGKKTLRK